MSINYIRTNVIPQTIGTTKTITIPTSPETLVVSDSGYMGWQIVCLGPGVIAYGGSSITAGTAGLLFYSMAKEWYPLADTMALFLRADSVATVVAVNEYF